MVTTENAPVSQTKEVPALDLLPLAPAYRAQAHLVVLTIYAALLVASQIPGHLGHQHGQIIAYVGPLLLLMFAIRRDTKGRERQTRQYAAGLLKRSNLPNTLENRALAAAAFEQRTTSSAIITFATLFAVIGLIASLSDLYLAGRAFSFATWSSALNAIGNGALYLLVFSWALICSTAPLGLVRHNSIDFEELVERSSVSGLELRESDRNDVELISVSVSLDSVHRRVETYTIESTLLSALSFSAFTAVIYSDMGPLEAAEWLGNVKWHCFGELPLCMPAAEEIVSHAMFITAACLLACAVFFLSVLVTRLRFNDAFRYTAIEQPAYLLRQLRAKRLGAISLFLCVQREARACGSAANDPVHEGVSRIRYSCVCRRNSNVRDVISLGRCDPHTGDIRRRSALWIC